MPENTSDVGIKTFFIAPDLSMITESFMELAFLEGFETYLIPDDPYVAMEDKVKTIVEHFDEIILFFSIDKGGSMQYWVDYISKLHAEHGNHVRIGVLYKNINSPEINDRIKRAYLFDIGIAGGCIPLHFSVPRNQMLLLDVLRANKAEGRRKSIRLLCSDKHLFNVIHEGKQFQGHVHDISISHFSCSFTAPSPDIDPFTVLQKIQLRVHGIICMVDAVVGLKRIVDKVPIYVFVFRSAKGHSGLDEKMKSKINGLICIQHQKLMEEKLQLYYNQVMASARRISS